MLMATTVRRWDTNPTGALVSGKHIYTAIFSRKLGISIVNTVITPSSIPNGTTDAVEVTVTFYLSNGQVVTVTDDEPWTIPALPKANDTGVVFRDYYNIGNNPGLSAEVRITWATTQNNGLVKLAVDVISNIGPCDHNVYSEPHVVVTSITPMSWAIENYLGAESGGNASGFVTVMLDVLFDNGEHSYMNFELHGMSPQNGADNSRQFTFFTECEQITIEIDVDVTRTGGTLIFRNVNVPPVVSVISQIIIP